MNQQPGFQKALRRAYSQRSIAQIEQDWLQAAASFWVFLGVKWPGSDDYHRAELTIELCEYELAKRGLCMMFNEGRWFAGPIPPPPVKDEPTQSSLF